MAVSIANPVGTELVHSGTGLATALAGFFAIFNGGGRPLFGFLTDRFSPQNTAMVTFALITLASLVMGQMPLVPVYLIAFSVLWGCLGVACNRPDCHGRLFRRKRLSEVLRCGLPCLRCRSDRRPAAERVHQDRDRKLP